MKLHLGGMHPLVDVKTNPTDPEFEYYKKLFANDPVLLSYFSTAKPLTRQQLEIVLNNDQNMLVIAGAGSGKTTTMVEKIAFLVNMKNVQAEQILFLTFTDDASTSMRKRLENRGVKGVICGTFHSIFGRLLSGYLNENIVSRLVSDEVQKHIVRAILKELKLSIEEREFLNQISNWKNQLLTPSDIAEEHFLKNAFVRYEEEKEKKNVIDFDDIQNLIYESLINDEFFRFSLINRYSHVFVDEYQDVNTAQVSILDLIMSGKTVHQVVGDPRQSIYGFRGSSPDFIMNFVNKYNAVQKSLSINFRSTPSIVELSNNLIAHNGAIGQERMYAFKAENSLYPEYSSHDTDVDEAIFIANKIAELRSSGQDLNEIAILVRNGFFADCIVNELQSRSIDFRLSAKSNFSLFNRPSIRSFLGILKLFSNENDLKALKAVKGFFFVSNAQFAKLEKMEFKAKSALRCMADLEFRYPNQLLTNFLIAFENSKGFAKPVDQLKFIYMQCFRTAWSSRPDMMTNVNDIEMFLSIIEHYNTSEEIFSHVEEYSEAVSKAHRNEIGVLIATLHGSKGLEWDVVFLTGLKDGLLPSKQNDNLSEERNLAYVGITRAKNMLYLTTPISHPYSDTINSSIFVRELGMKGFKENKKRLFA